MANAASIHATVARAARKHGGAAVLRKRAVGTVDDLNDTDTPDAVMEYPCFAIWLPYAPLLGLSAGESFQAGQGRIIRGEVCYISPSDFPAGIEPKPGDTLVITATGVERGIFTVEGLRLTGSTPLYFRCAVSP